MKDKVAIITGSSKGIGKVIAFEFLKAGCKVVINGRDDHFVNATSEHFATIGYSVLPAPADVTKADECAALVRITLKQFGKLDILINNAGGGFRGPFDKTLPEVFKQVVDLNLMSAVYMTHAAIEEIKKAKGSIVFISSLSGIRGLPLNSPYCVAKMGLTALAQSLRLELSGTGVHVGIVMVGLTDYDENKRIVAADGSLVPIRRRSHQSREQVAKIVLKMVSRRKYYKVLTPLGIVTNIFQKISPSLVEWIIGRSSKTGDYNK